MLYGSACGHGSPRYSGPPQVRPEWHLPWVASHRDCHWVTLHLPRQIFLDFSFQYCQIDLGDVYTIRIRKFSFFLLYSQQKRRKAKTIVQEGLIHFHLQSIPFI